MTIKKKSTKQTVSTKRWSAHVTKTSHALDLEYHIFRSHNPKHIAQSLKHSAEISQRRKGTPFQSAMSMLNFYINRAGTNLPEEQKNILEKTKEELRKLFGREQKQNAS